MNGRLREWASQKWGMRGGKVLGQISKQASEGKGMDTEKLEKLAFPRPTGWGCALGGSLYPFHHVLYERFPWSTLGEAIHIVVWISVTGSFTAWYIFVICNVQFLYINFEILSSVSLWGFLHSDVCTCVCACACVCVCVCVLHLVEICILNSIFVQV